METFFMIKLTFFVVSILVIFKYGFKEIIEFKDDYNNNNKLRWNENLLDEYNMDNGYQSKASKDESLLYRIFKYENKKIKKIN